MQPFAAPPASSGTDFMWLEPLELDPGGLAAEHRQQQPGQQPGQQQPVAAVLHVRKAAQHLALRFCCPSSSSAGRSCSAAVAAQRLQCFCADTNACLVAVGAHLYGGHLDATFLLCASSLQHLDRTALLRHFA